MNRTWRQLFDEAVGPLGWGFEEGEDGNVISLALDEAASLLKRLPEFDAVDAVELSELLAHSKLRDQFSDLQPVDDLYELSGRHNYGIGFTSEDADEATEVAEVVLSLLQEVADLVDPGKKRE